MLLLTVLRLVDLSLCFGLSVSGGCDSVCDQRIPVVSGHEESGSQLVVRVAIVPRIIVSEEVEGLFGRWVDTSSPLRFCALIVGS